MAIRLEDEYTEAVPADANYPGGSIKNASSPTATDGTPVDEKWGNDLIGFLQGLLLQAGITPSGVPDTAPVSQYVDAVRAIAGLNAGAVATVSASRAITKSDIVLIVDASGGNVELTLLGASDSTARAIRVQRARSDASSNTVTITPSGVDTIGGETTLEIGFAGEGYELIPDGTSDYLQFQI